MSPRRVGVILRHELRLTARDPISAMVLVVFPLITMAFLKPAFRAALQQVGYAHANGAEQAVPGEAVIGAFFIVSLTTFAFFSEFGWMTWDRLRASSATSLEIVLGKAIPRVAIVLVQLALMVGLGVAVFGLHAKGNLLALGPMLVVFSVSLVLLGVAVTAVCRTAQQASAFATVGMVLFGAIGGALVPYSVLPLWAKRVAPATPTYWAMRGFRSVVLDGRGLGALTAPTFALAGMGVLFAVVALRRLRFDEAKTSWM